MTAENLHHVKRLAEGCGCVVVSAPGRCADGEKVTDMLYRHFYGDGRAWKLIENRFLKIAAVNGIRCDVEKLLWQARRRSMRSLPYCLSLGEELSARLCAQYIGAQYIEAEDCLRFDKGFNARLSVQNLRKAFMGVKQGVMGGFYGGCDGGRRVFSRGGGDVSGCIAAVALGSSVYRNWTDVEGVCRADPRRIQSPTIPFLSYGQMYRMAVSGAQVMHPQAVTVAKRAAMPVVVASFFNENAPFTLISNCPSPLPFLSASEKIAGERVCTVLFNLPKSQVCRLIAQTVKGDARVELGDFLRVYSKNSLLKPLYDAFSAVDVD